MASVQAKDKKVSPKIVEEKTKESYPSNIKIETKTKPSAQMSANSRGLDKASNPLKDKPVMPKISQAKCIENGPSNNEIVPKTNPKVDLSENMKEKVRKPVKQVSSERINSTARAVVPIKTDTVKKATHVNNRDIKSTSNTTKDKKLSSNTNVSEQKEIELSTIKKAKSDEDLSGKKTSPKMINGEAIGNELPEDNRKVAVFGTGVDMSENDPACELSKECSKC